MMTTSLGSQENGVPSKLDRSAINDNIFILYKLQPSQKDSKGTFSKIHALR